ncbi:MAG: hypothetical protein AAGC81_09505 [Pseudomonadota bacterium]
MHSDHVSSADQIPIADPTPGNSAVTSGASDASGTRCLTELSGATLAVGALASSALLWIAVIAVI